ncbi:hypothetical protein IWX90DRAFT_446055 [Phyllosticta citrichinensis]|uniref:Uncharacterized protein n=1 Tax=Phyllosticta citrichinensis TaxID=1130410 RepID=A0ABR1XFR6_9PEZI
MRLLMRARFRPLRELVAHRPPVTLNLGFTLFPPVALRLLPVVRRPSRVRYPVGGWAVLFASALSRLSAVAHLPAPWCPITHCCARRLVASRQSRGAPVLVSPVSCPLSGPRPGIPLLSPVARRPGAWLVKWPFSSCRPSPLENHCGALVPFNQSPFEFSVLDTFEDALVASVELLSSSKSTARLVTLVPLFLYLLYAVVARSPLVVLFYLSREMFIIFYLEVLTLLFVTYRRYRHYRHCGTFLWPSPSPSIHCCQFSTSSIRRPGFSQSYPVLDPQIDH